MKFFQANFDKIKPGKRYYIFQKKKIIKVEVVSSWEEFNHKIWGRWYCDVGVRVKRVDNGNYLPRLRTANELYTRNGS